jgi:hypothetical protein
MNIPPASSRYECMPRKKPQASEPLITRRVLACFKVRKAREGEERKERKEEKMFQ